MKPIDQTLFGWPHGNCHSACLASIFEVPLDSVPHDLGSRPDVREAIDSFLSGLGYKADCFSFKRGHEWWPEWNSHCVIVGLAERGFDHAVVGLHGNIVHDPHPSRAGLIGINCDVWIYTVKPP